jgi:hypothetical protein
MRAFLKLHEAGTNPAGKGRIKGLLPHYSRELIDSSMDKAATGGHHGTD